ncbi:MAG: hypothetical protein CSA60_04390, partial [Neptuniibacter caesariensis]
IAETRNVFFGGEENDAIQGGDGDDRLYGGSGSDLIQGEGGDDYLEGNRDSDVLFGGEGADTIIGGHDSDALFANEGDNSNDGAVDKLYGGQGDDVYYMGGGDIATDSEGSDTYIINTESGGGEKIIITDADKKGSILLNDQLITYAVSASDNSWLFDTNTLSLKNSGAGQSLIITDFNGNEIEIENFTSGDFGIKLGTYLGNDLPAQEATSGVDDTIYESASGLNIDALAGDDVLYFRGVGGDFVEGNEGSDILAGGGGNDHLYAGAQGDLSAILNSAIQELSSGFDSLSGGRGDDLLVGSRDSNWINGGADNDTVFSGAGDDIIYGDSQKIAEVVENYAEADTLLFDGLFSGPINPDDYGRDYLYAGTGNDIVHGQGGDDFLFGESGDDVLRGDETGLTEGGAPIVLFAEHHGSDYIDGGSGNDKVKGDGGNDHLYGGAGDDELFGDADDISLSIHGDDHLYGGAGRDQLVGNGGNDYLYGGTNNDHLMGDGGQTSSAMIGDDFLDGGQGDDHLEGEGGDDQLIGGQGIDKLYGGQGDDTYRFELGDARVVNTKLDSIYDTVTENNLIVFGQGIKITDIELIASNAGVVVAYGDEAIYIKNGDSGAIGAFEFEETGQSIRFEELMSERFLGDREVYGTDIDDVLVGGAGNNRLVGGEGNDRLLGGAGNSVLEGGIGNDILISRGGYDSLYGGEGDDRYEVSTSSSANVLITDQSGSNSLIMHSVNDAQETYFNLVGDDLIIVTGSSQITIQNWESSGFTSYQLSDGTTLSSSDVNTRLNTAPIALGPQSLEVDEDSLIEIDLAGFFNDPEADGLNFIIKQVDGSGLPAWLTYNADTRSVSGTPENSDVGHLSLIIEAIDSGGLSATTTLSIDVHNTNDAPVAVADSIVPVFSTPELNYSIQIGHSPEELHKAETWIEKHGGGVVVFWRTEDGSGEYAWQYQKLSVDGSIESEVKTLDLQGAELMRVYSAGEEIKVLTRLVKETEPRNEHDILLRSLDSNLEISSPISLLGSNEINEMNWGGSGTGEGVEVVWEDGNKYGILWQVGSDIYAYYNYSVVDTFTGETSHYGEYSYGAVHTSLTRLSEVESVLIVDGYEVQVFNPEYDHENQWYTDSRYNLNNSVLADTEKGGRFTESFAHRIDENHIMVLGYMNPMYDGNRAQWDDYDLYYSVINTQDDSVSDYKILTEFLPEQEIIDVDYYSGEGVENSIFVTFSERQQGVDNYEIKGRFISTAGDQLGGDVLLSRQPLSEFKVFSDVDYHIDPRKNGNNLDEGDVSYNSIVRDGTIYSVWSSSNGVHVSSVVLNSVAIDHFTFDPLANDYDVDAKNINETLTLVAAEIINGLGTVEVVDGKVIYDAQGCYEYLPDDQQTTVAIQYTIRDQAGAESSSTITVNLNGKLDHNSFSDYVVFNPFNTATASVVTSDANDYVQIDYNRAENEVVAEGKNYAIDLGAGDDIVTFKGIGYSGYRSRPYAGFIWDVTGGLGNDSFVMLGDNYDTIYINDPMGNNQLIFTVPAQHYGLSSSGLSTNLNLVPTLSYGSLKLTFEGFETEIHLENFNPDDVLGGPRDINYFEFNGVGYSYEELVALGFDLQGDAADNEITGTSVVDRIYGGTGNDSLAGGGGDDSYFFNSGEGHDVIIDTQGVNRLILEDSISLEDLQLSTHGGDLIIVINENDSVTIKDWATEKESSIAAIISGDQSLSTADIESRVFSLESLPEFQLTEDESISGINLLDYINGYQGAFSTVLIDVDSGEVSDWLSVDSETGAFVGTPLNKHVGSGRYLLRLTLETGHVAEQEISYTVVNTNDAPELSGNLEDLNVSLAEVINITLPEQLFSDVDAGDQLATTVTQANGDPLPDWLKYDPDSGSITGVADLEQLGSHQLKVVATDLSGEQAEALFSIHIQSGEGDVLGTEETDFLVASLCQDSALYGGAGSDYLYGLFGDDYLSGGSGHDTIMAGIGDDRLFGGTGDDWISAGFGDDYIETGAGNDTVFAGPGNDVIVVGEGDDFLSGGRGGDRYQIGLNSGHNRIKERCSSNDSDDAVAFVDSITKEDLWFSRDGDHLAISVIGTGDSVQLDRWYAWGGSRIEAIEAGGERLDYTAVDALVQAMASFDAPSGAGEVLSQDMRNTLQPVLAASWTSVEGQPPGRWA